MGRTGSDGHSGECISNKFISHSVYDLSHTVFVVSLTVFIAHRIFKVVMQKLVPAQMRQIILDDEDELTNLCGN